MQSLSELLAKAEAKGVLVLPPWMHPRPRSGWTQYNDDIGVQIIDAAAESSILLAIVQWLAERGVAVYFDADRTWLIYKDIGDLDFIPIPATDFRTAILEAFSRELDSISAGKASGGGADAR